MAKKQYEQKQTVDEVPETPAEIAAKVEQIKSFFDKIHQVEGVTFDPANPDHVIIAAFMVGMRHYLRR